MLEPKQLFDYQKEAIMHQLAHPQSMLWMGMGLGKTVVTLTSIIDRMRAGVVKKTLIFGPVNVIHGVWERESRKWSHTKHLTCQVLSGTPATRRRKFFKKADIYLCSYENMTWLAELLKTHYLDQGLPLPFEMVVYDEITKMKNSQSVRAMGGKRERKDRQKRTHMVNVVGWKKIRGHFNFTTGLTGTPASNGYIDLFGQYLVLDNGERLGEYITHYRDNYFISDYMGWGYTVSDAGKQWIEQKIGDITLKMDTRDYLDLPPCKESNIMVELPPKARKHYNEMEDNMFSALDNGKELEVFSKSSVSNKCLQICNGNPYLTMEDYDEGSRIPTQEYEVVHGVKLDALENVLEEAGGRPVLVAYTFRSDAEQIMKKFKKYKPVNMTAEKGSDTEKIVNDWNSGKIKLMVGHPASIGHGIDGLQESGSIVVWMGLTWSLELYMQLNKRIDRQGQKHPVSIIRILCSNTLDLAVADALMRKDDDEQGLKDSISRYRAGIVHQEGGVTFM